MYRRKNHAFIRQAREKKSSVGNEEIGIKKHKFIMMSEEEEEEDEEDMYFVNKVLKILLASLHV